MVKIELETGNEAFSADRRGEIARILNEIAVDIINGAHAGPISDTNGNTVGWFGINEQED